MKKWFINRELNIKAASIVLSLIYIVSILPMLYISRYNYPSADDFAMGVEAYRAFRDTGNFFAALGQGVYMAWYDYIHWMGYFTSTFFMSVPPSVFGEKFYILGTYIMLGILSFATLYFMHALLCKALRINAHLANCITMIILIVTVQCLPQGMARVESFYWYCSAANYILMYSQGLIFLGLLISAVQDNRKSKRRYDFVMAMIIGFFVGGGNYLTSLSISIIIFFLMLIIVLNRLGIIFLWKDNICRKEIIHRMNLLIFPSLLLLIGFACSCFAPGNANRASGLTGMKPLKAIFTSLYYTLRYPIGEWTNFAVICFLLLLIPFLWKAVQKVKLPFNYPGWAVLLVYGLVSANIVPPMYAEGNINAGRLQALFWMQYVLYVTLLEGYLLGWLQQRFSIRISNGSMPFDWRKYICFVSVLLAFGSALSVHVNPDFYAGTSALEDILNGHAQVYAQQNQERQAILKDVSIQDVVFDAYTYEPDLLFFADITTDRSEWTNEAVRRYYDKKSVVRLAD